ncbi:universal stress protein [Aequorivita sublithincola]
MFLGTRGRMGLKHFLMGSTAERVMAIWILKF